MKASEHQTLMRIMTYSYNTKKISDKDVDFVAALLRCGPLCTSATNENSLRMSALSSLVTVKQATPTQKEKIVAAIAPICEDPSAEYIAPVAPGVPSAEVSVQNTALLVLGHCDTPKAREICARLSSNSATERVRQAAAGYLRRWGGEKQTSEATPKIKGG